MSTVPEFVLPASFQPHEFLPGALAMRADDARWFISTILIKTANRDIDLWGCVRLHSDILRRVMAHDDSATVIRALVNGGAIEAAPHSAGVRSKGYRLAARYLGDRCVRLRAVDTRLIERVQRERERWQAQVQASSWLPIHHALAAEQWRITIVGDEADRILDGLPEHTRLCQDVLVSNIRRRDHKFSVSSTGRVFNWITGLKRELRSALRIDGERVGSVDIRCAQPALLAMTLTQKYPSMGLISPATYKDMLCRAPLVVLADSCATLCCDCATFERAACDGSLYEVLCRLTGESRDYVKFRLLKDVLAKKGRYPSLVEDAFRSEFPSVFRAIRQINKHDHGTLIRLLQQAESALVIEQVSQRLLWSGVRFVTLHDAVFAGVGSLDAVEAAFAEVFDEIGFTLSLKRSAEPIRRIA